MKNPVLVPPERGFAFRAAGVAPSVGRDIVDGVDGGRISDGDRLAGED